MQVERDYGCAPFEVVFLDTGIVGDDFLWEFGDGTPPLFLPETQDVTHTSQNT